jgi:hypothetical protein
MSELSVEEIAEWWKTASLEQRMEMLEAIGGYDVSETTWYVHPEGPEDMEPT